MLNFVPSHIPWRHKRLRIEKPPKLLDLRFRAGAITAYLSASEGVRNLEGVRAALALRNVHALHAVAHKLRQAIQGQAQAIAVGRAENIRSGFPPVPAPERLAAIPDLGRRCNTHRPLWPVRALLGYQNPLVPAGLAGYNRASEMARRQGLGIRALGSGKSSCPRRTGRIQSGVRFGDTQATTGQTAEGEGWAEKYLALFLSTERLGKWH